MDTALRLEYSATALYHKRDSHNLKKLHIYLIEKLWGCYLDTSLQLEPKKNPYILGRKTEEENLNLWM